MTSTAQQERQALCDTLLRVGPDAATVSDPWRTRDLAAHLVIRDSRPDLAAGMAVPPLRARLDRAQREMAAGDWDKLVDRLRQGPPALSPARIRAVDDAVNTVEFFVHHEDVLRGTPGTERRRLDPRLEKALWRSLRRSGKLMYRRSTVGAVLVTDGYGRYAVKGPGEEGTVVLRGRPGELLLFSYGRSRVADVAVEGPDAAVAQIREARLGLS
jgi:uncharacterized protein (TIGR03085 family)